MSATRAGRAVLEKRGHVPVYFFFLMLRRPPRSTLLSLHDALPIYGVNRVGKILPRAAYSRHLRLSSEFAVGTDLTRNARYFRRERTQLIAHRVDGVFEFENFALHVDRDLARQVAASHGRCDFGDVTHLAGKIAGHEV